MKLWVEVGFVFCFVALTNAYPSNYEKERQMHPGVSRNPNRLTPLEFEDKDFWFNSARESLNFKLNEELIEKKAKNVIFFLGDGMSVPTITAARIFKGQRVDNMTLGEEAELHFDRFPHVAVSKTFCSDSQTADSACSATAYLCGTKANDGTIGVSPAVKLGDCNAQNEIENQVSSILAWSQAAGKSTGIVTTARVTHASPAGAYAHIAHRYWEDDYAISRDGVNPEECDDIAEQLILHEPGKNINVILGGGRARFFDVSDVTFDPEGGLGRRRDGKNLVNVWKDEHRENSAYVTSKDDLLAIDTRTTENVLGLFAPSHIAYLDRQETDNDPSLEEMTKVAIEILEKNPEGYFLFVEGGRIDHAHHATNAQRALWETIEFDKAIKLADEKTSADDTLLLVTSDHAHVMTMAGYPERGQNLLTFREIGSDNIPIPVLSYANGPGFRLNTQENTRHDISNDDLENLDYKQITGAPLVEETHGGDDVLIFSRGPFSHLLTGVQQQSYIPHALAYASCVGERLTFCGTNPAANHKTVKNSETSAENKVEPTEMLLSNFKSYTKDEFDLEEANMHPGVYRKPKIESEPEYENKEFWFNSAQASLASQLEEDKIQKEAKNTILFLGDGMSIPTITAARIFKGQKVDNSAWGEEAELYFESFPHIGVSKTFCSDSQTADSACSATAYLCGTKANDATMGVSSAVKARDCAAQNEKENHVSSILAWSQAAGKSTGIVTTARVTHASPGGTYAHIAHRDWEDDYNVVRDGQDPDTCDDIAEQLIRNDPGRNINVILGGGRARFYHAGVVDPEGGLGYRTDGVNLIDEWKDRHQENSAYITSKSELDGINVTSTDYLLGLFAPSHIAYLDAQERDDDPSLEEMTKIAIQILSKNPNGYFLFVEGGRIDHAHHDTNAQRALWETIEFDKAIKSADEMIDIEDTLVVVTSDHAHVMTLAGYPERGNPLLTTSGMGRDNLPYPTLSYANGPGYRMQPSPETRYDLTDDDFEDINYLQITLAPRSSETHGGDDVLIFSKGPFSHLLTGVQQQSYIPHVMAYASCVGSGPRFCQDTTTTTTEDSSPPPTTTEDSNPPPTTTEDSNPPPTTTEDSNPPPTTTEDSNPPPTTTEDSNPPPTTTEDSNDPPTTTEDSNPPPTTTEDSNPPPTTTEDSNDPPTTTEDSNAPPSTTDPGTTPSAAAHNIFSINLAISVIAVLQMLYFIEISL